MPAPLSPIRIGVSSCLLGEEVRFDGGHKRDRYIVGTLDAYFEWVPVCPEVEVGLGTPRETIRLIDHGDGERLETSKGGVDLTERMDRYSQQRARALTREGLSGYLLKKDSPSCGMERVKVHLPGRAPRKNGVGRFAAALLEAMPNLPVEEEGRLHDPILRENWIERVFAYHALQQLWQPRWTVGQLVRFHTIYKMVLFAHSEKEYRELGRLVAKAKTMPRADVREQYEAGFMSAMKKLATTRKNTNVLQHMMGYFKKDLDAASKQELLQLIDDYRQGLVPLVVPLTLVAHYVRVLDVEYLRDQVYLKPHPKELALRNHV